MAGASERTAVLVIRAWLEEDDDAKRLRARITSTLDASARQATDTIGAASEKEIVNAVRTWLRAFAARQ
jgi:hypothetical protein